MGIRQLFIESSSELKEYLRKKGGRLIQTQQECPDVYEVIESDNYCIGIIGNSFGIRPILLTDNQNRVFTSIGTKVFVFDEEKIIFSVDTGYSAILDIMLNNGILLIISELEVIKIDTNTWDIIWKKDYSCIMDYSVKGNFLELVDDNGTHTLDLN